MAETVGQVGEDALIELFSVEGGALGEKVLVPNGDDCAAWFVEPKYASVITTDTLVEGVHFDRAYTPATALGRKLVAVSLSDVAAMGATARYLLLSVCLPPETEIRWVVQLTAGIREICRAHGVAVIGGNTTRIQGPVVLTSTVIGRIQPPELIRRRGSLLGDAIFVTGRLGEARAGLELLQAGLRPGPEDSASSLVAALIDPQPRLKAGRRLAEAHLAHAMCDVSDGLGRDLRRLLIPEGLGARLEANLLPLSAPLRSFCGQKGRSPIDYALRGGEDYELLFTAAPEDEPAIHEACAQAGTPVSRIGVVTAGPEVEIFLEDGTVLEVPTGFEHFEG